MQLTILDFMQLAHGSLRSQRILRVLHWIHESAGRFRRLGSPSLMVPVGVAGPCPDADADECAAASVSVSMSMSASASAHGSRARRPKDPVEPRMGEDDGAS